VRPTRVLHLAAQAGVRYSIDAPDDYTDANLLGFANVLQGCRTQQVAHLVFASSPASTAATPAAAASATRWTTPSATTPPPRRPTS
jgi:nucleoside-diphosphate-sugar epimerase